MEKFWCKLLVDEYLRVNTSITAIICMIASSNVIVYDSTIFLSINVLRVLCNTAIIVQMLIIDWGCKSAVGCKSSLPYNLTNRQICAHIYIRWHLWVLHVSVSVAIPWQSAPRPCIVGLSHVLPRVRKPFSQVAEHSVQLPHAVQPPLRSVRHIGWEKIVYLNWFNIFNWSKYWNWYIREQNPHTMWQPS